jgi:hypothetical protein
MVRYELDLSGSRQGQVVGACECGSSFGEFLD